MDLADNKPVLAFDSDEVLFNFVRDFLAMHFNPKYGTSFTEQDVFSYDLENVVGKTREEVIEEIAKFYRTDNFDGLTPMEGAVEIMHVLKDRYDLHVVTARPDFVRDKTLRAFEKHFPGCFVGYHFTNQYHGGNNVKEKLEVCRDIEAIAIVEDSYRNAMQCADAGIRAFLLKRKWNEKSAAANTHPNLTPINHLTELLNHL
jgi:5'(3')-deoxyribonucleotidase